MPRMVLPPGPISRPIFSGLNLRPQQPRSPAARSRRAAAKWCVSIFRKISMRASRRLAQRGRDDLRADAVDLQIELNAGDAVLRAGDLEIHVAEVVLVADDVGQQGPAGLGSFTSPTEMPATGFVIGTPAAISPKVRTADAGHRAGAVRLEDVGDDADRVGELLRRRGAPA